MNEILKHITERLVRFFDTPKEQRLHEKRKRKEQQGHWTNHWFGMLPEALRMFFGKEKR